MDDYPQNCSLTLGIVARAVKDMRQSPRLLAEIRPHFPLPFYRSGSGQSPHSPRYTASAPDLNMPFDVHKKEIARTHPISQVPRTLAHRTDSLPSPGENLLACPGPNRRWGGCSVKFYPILEVISKACGRFPVGRKAHGNVQDL